MTKLPSNPVSIKQQFAPSALRPEQVEAIWTMTGLGKRPKEIAKSLCLHPETVRKYLVSLQAADPTVRHALMSSRAQRARAYSEYLAQKAILVLETIDGTALEKSSVQQRGVLAGILVDKSKVMGDRAQDLENWVDESASRGGKVGSRTNVETLLDSIKGRIERLTFLQVDLPAGMKDKIQAVEAQVLEVKNGTDKLTGTPTGTRRGRPSARLAANLSGGSDGQETEERPEAGSDVREGGEVCAPGGGTFVPAGDESDSDGTGAFIETTGTTPAAFIEVESATENIGVSAAGALSTSEETDGTS